MDLTRIFSPSGAPFTVGGNYADRFTAFLKDLETNGYPVMAKQSGGYNDRNIAGTSTPSQHAYGRAIDVNWADNPRGGSQPTMPPFLADSLARRHGLTWGGLWSNPDPMHFEVADNTPAPRAKNQSITAYSGLAPQPSQPQSQDTAAMAPFGGSGILSQPQQRSPEEDELYGILGKLKEPDLGDMLLVMGGNIAATSGFGQGGWGAGIGNGLKDIAGLQQQNQNNRIKIAGALLENKQRTAGSGMTDDVKEYHYAVSQGFRGSLLDYMKAKRANAGVPSGFQQDPNDPERLSFTPGGPYDPETIAAQSQARGRGRQFSVNDISKLSDEGAEFANVRSFAKNFQDTYGGYTPGFGNVNMAAARAGFAMNENATNAASWWQEYDRYKNKIRNEQFGATLTPSERAEWLKADIHPEMDPKIIRKNLATQQRLVESAVRRKASALVQAKYDPDVISEAYGIDLSGMGIGTDVRGAGSAAGVPSARSGEQLPQGAITRQGPPGVPAITPAQPQAGGARAIPQQAVQYLMQNPSPEIIQQFEQKYGPGSARQILQGR